MSFFRKLITASSSLFSGTLSFIASLASIIGLLIICFTGKNQAIIALSVFVLFLLVILLKFIHVVDRLLLRKHEAGFYKFATYVKYFTEDGRHISYDLQKFIQCKTISMSEFEHKYFWTGSKPPLITSQNQIFSHIIPSITGGMDKAILKFKTPLVFNEFCILQVKMDIDDSDGKSKHFCGQLVEDNVHIIQFRVELRHLSNAPDAKILKRNKFAAAEKDFDIVEYVKFDTSSKSYEHILFNPQKGYDYRLDWS